MRPTDLLFRSFVRDATFVIATTLVTASLAFGQDAAIPFDAASYARLRDAKGVVLVSANWSARRNCGTHATAQLLRLGFDLAGAPKASVDAPADLTMEDGAFVPGGSAFVDYAFIVAPGEYVMSGFTIRVAQSANELGFVVGRRATLIDQGASTGGRFRVGRGEVVYIGHFGIDCVDEPIPWRFYRENRASFDLNLATLRRKYDGLPTEKAVFRLFETTAMGQPFALP